MTNSFAYSGSFNGFAFGNGARPGASVRSLTGFGSIAATATVTSRPDGGGYVGQVAKGPKQVRLGLNLHTASQSQLNTLRDEIGLRFDPSNDELPLTIFDRSMFVKVLEVDPGRDPAWPGPEVTSPCDVLFQAGDPITYGPEGDISFGGDSPVASADLSFTNAGNTTTRSGRAWTLRMLAHGTVLAPFIQLGDQIVTWEGLTMTGGQVLTVDVYRRSRVGTRGVDGYRRSAGASEFPDHPVLQVGANTVTVGCASGLISGNFHPRSQWS